MKLAVIDQGTNSSRLMIAESSNNDFKVLKKELIITRMGQGVDKTGKINQEAYQRVIKALGYFREIIKDYQVEKIMAVGTSALRDLENKDEFIENIEQVTDIKLKSISGEKEAELIFKGAATFNNSKELLVIDIGGGSTEFIWTEKDKLNLRSLNLGCVRLTERHILDTSKVVLDHEVKKISENIIKCLNSLEINNIKKMQLIGVGGTITTLAAVKQGLIDYSSERIEGYHLTRSDIVNLLDKFKNMSLAKRKKIAGLQPGRADVIVSGTIILKEILNYFDKKELIVSDRDILYGMLVEVSDK